VRLPTILDSRGKESTTLFLIMVPYIVVMVKFLFGGLVLQQAMGPEFKVIWTFPPMTGGEFMAAISPLLAAWWARERQEKNIIGGMS